MRYLFVITSFFLFVSCTDNFSDKDKRNENWVWWIDAKTGKASWVQVNSDGPRVTDGKYTQFHFNGNVYEKGKLVDGNNVDTIFDFDIDGRPQEYRILSSDTDYYGEKINRVEYFYKNGPTKLFYSNGSVEAVGIVENHQIRNKWTVFFKNGVHKRVRDLEKGLGWILLYYNNGRIRDSIYVDRDSSYLISHYYILGQLAKKIDFKNHNYNGLQREYYLNGRLKFICPIVDGKLSGRSKKWFEDGHLMEVCYRKDGELNGGPDTAYYDSGKIKVITYARNNQLDGEVKGFNESGKLTMDRIVKDGLIIEDKLKSSLLIRH